LLTGSRRLTLLAFLMQTLNIGFQVGKVGYPFLLEARDSYSFSAWVLTGLLLLLSSKNRFELAGVFILPAVMILETLARFSKEDYLGATGLANSPWASAHIVFGFLSLSIFILSFLMGLVYLFQEFQIKRKKIYYFFARLPSLDLLDRLHAKALGAGFLLLTLGIITGSAWAKSVKGVYFFDDPRQLWTLIGWLAYAFFFQARLAAGWRGRRGVLLSLIGFTVILFTFLEVRHA
jgi:ABC-type transport system involved in cytochrome c biogenesis permease subunit